MKRKILKYVFGCIGSILLGMCIGLSLIYYQDNIFRALRSGAVKVYNTVQITHNLIFNEIESVDPPYEIHHVKDIPYLIYDRMYNSVVKINFDFNGKHSCGTGVVIYADENKSYILTNRHLGAISVSTGQEITTTMLAEPIRGQTIVISNIADLALLRVDVPLRTVPISNKSIRLREPTVVIGSPLCENWFTNEGFLMKHDIQVLGSWADALTNETYPGNSGSPVFNMDGDLAGLIFAANPRMHGIGFSIPLKDIKQFLSNINFPNVEEKELDKNQVSKVYKQVIRNLKRSTAYLPIGTVKPNVTK